MMRFTPALETAYTESRLVENAGWRSRLPLFGCAAVMLSLVCDALIIPATFEMALWLKLGVLCPLLIAGMILSRRTRSAAVMEGIDVVMVVTFAAIELSLLQMARTPQAAAANAILPILPIVPNLINKVRFSIALPLTVVLCLAVIGGCVFSSNFDQIMLGAVIVPMLITAVTTLLANRGLEACDRRLYLGRLRDQFAHASLVRDHRELNRVARLDPLTGLSNRRDLAERLDDAWDWARQTDGDLAVLMVDVDHFKRFNDRYGHPTGDECLRRIARILRGTVHREGQVVARYGGEEFLVLLPALSQDDATRLAERIRRAIEAASITNDTVQTGIVSVSIGVASAMSIGAGTTGDLLRAADVALYEAKERGRNRVYPPLLSLADDADMVSWA